MKALIFLCIMLFFNIDIVHSQSGTFDFSSGTVTNVGSTVTQQISGITLTVTTGSGSVGLYDGSIFGINPSTATPQCFDESGTTSMTLTFSGTVNIKSIYCLEGVGATFKWDFTPTGGSNSALLNQTIDGYNGTTVTLNYIGITAINITRSTGQAGSSIYFGVDNIIMDAALPVELTTFTALLAENSVLLNWATATEVNNYGFNVERKPETGDWETIEFVNGHGNSNSPREYSYIDNSPLAGSSLYRLKQIDFDGAYKYYDAINVSLTSSANPELMQNSPNPFNPSTAIKFYIPENNIVNIKIYDILGREVTTLLNSETQAGYHIVYWNGKDKYNNNAASGVYLYKLTAGNFSETRKMNLLK